MMRYLFFSVYFFLLLYPILSFSQSPDITITDADKAIIREVVAKFDKYKDLETGDLMTKIGMHFSGSPYVAHTLEINDKEKLVINLREMDCTTFAENCLALARTIKNNKRYENTFFDELRTIRYRSGLIDRYPSRLHYFSDWIYDNDKKDIVTNITAKSGGISKKIELNFMSTHTDGYYALKMHPEFISEISNQEKAISKRQFKFIPKTKFGKYEKKIKNGDIIGISTNIAGMDIMHVVIALWKDDKLHILHASQSKEKVLVSEETLYEYLLNTKKATGIVIARPN
jgi:hypothetical protein